MEITTERIPERRERPDAGHVADALWADAPCQTDGVGAGGAKEWSLESAVGPGSLIAEFGEATAFIRPREGGDGVGASLRIGEEVEPIFIPGMARQHFQRLEDNVAGEISICCGEQLVENPAHGEYRRPGIHRAARWRKLADLAARCRFLFDHSDIATARGEQGGGTQPAYSRTDNDDLVAHAIDSFGVDFRVQQAVNSP